MTNLWEKVQTILQENEIPDRHTFFQLKNFVIGKECTVQGQLWQAIREMKARKESVEALELQIENAEDELELIDIKIERIQTLNQTDPFVARESVILKRKAEREKRTLITSIEKVKSKIKFLMEEIRFFVGAFDNLSKTQSVKPIDDIHAQKEYWNEKLQEELNIRLILKNPIDSSFVQTVLSLDDDAPVKVDMMEMLKGVQKKMIEQRDQARSLEAERKRIK